MSTAESIVIKLDKLLLKASLRKGALQIQREPAVINGALVLGSAIHARNTELLASLGITQIVNCATRGETQTGAAFYSGPISYTELGAADEEDYDLIARHGEVVHALLADRARRPGQRVFVHCVAGRNRAASLVIAHLVLSGVPLLEAVANVASKRPLILGNPGFKRQLASLELARRQREQLQQQQGCNK